MTEAEWLACDDFWPVLARVREVIPSQRVVLWWFACCWCARGALSGREKAAVEALEATARTPSFRTTGKFLQAVRTAFASRPSRAAQFAHLLRDVVGNPFRSVAFAPEWRTDTATAVAAQMYGSRDFGAMPILADALQDAGCDSADVLDHCRGPGPHVRGCWVVDLVLGKE